MSTVNKVVLLSKLISKKEIRNEDGSITHVNLFLNTCTDGTQFFAETEHPLNSQAVSLTEKKAGDKYKDPRSGEEKIVAKDGWLYNGSAGNSVAIRESRATVDAMAELTAIKF